MNFTEFISFFQSEIVQIYVQCSFVFGFLIGSVIGAVAIILLSVLIKSIYLRLKVNR